jgi:hypothetical protein
MQCQSLGQVWPKLKNNEKKLCRVVWFWAGFGVLKKKFIFLMGNTFLNAIYIFFYIPNKVYFNSVAFTIMAPCSRHWKIYFHHKSSQYKYPKIMNWEAYEGSSQ